MTSHLALSYFRFHYNIRSPAPVRHFFNDKAIFTLHRIVLYILYLFYFVSVESFIDSPAIWSATVEYLLPATIFEFTCRSRILGNLPDAFHCASPSIHLATKFSVGLLPTKRLDLPLLERLRMLEQRSCVPLQFPDSLDLYSHGD